jgi:hypothetical protein
MMPMDSEPTNELRMLAGLPAYEPDVPCRDQVRGRCHALLLAKRKRAEATPIPLPAPSWRHVFGYGVVGAVCGVYLAAVVQRAMALYGF